MPRYSIKLVRASTKQKEPYTQEELKRLLKRPNTNICSFAEYRNWVMVNFLLATGCRASTLIELQIKDIDLPAGMVFFRHMKARNQIIVPLSQSMAKMLQEYLTYREGENEASLFISETGARLTHLAHWKTPYTAIIGAVEWTKLPFICLGIRLPRCTYRQVATRSVCKSCWDIQI